MSEKQNTVAEDLSKSITNANDTTSYNYDNDPEKAAIETRVYRNIEDTPFTVVGNITKGIELDNELKRRVMESKVQEAGMSVKTLMNSILVGNRGN